MIPKGHEYIARISGNHDIFDLWGNRASRLVPYDFLYSVDEFARRAFEDVLLAETSTRRATVKNRVLFHNPHSEQANIS